MKIENIYRKHTCNENREMTEERFKDAVKEILEDYTEWLIERDRIRLKIDILEFETIETKVQQYLFINTNVIDEKAKINQ